TVNETQLDEKLAQLERLRNWSPRVISKLEAFIRNSDDYALFRVDPIQYAAEKGMTENEAIDLFLNAAKLGLFDLEWNLICACCGQVFTSLRSIGHLHTHFICSLCRFENNLQLDDFIQISFTIAPSIRENIFHNPDSLSAEDYAFRYRLVKGIQRQPGHGSNADYFKKNTPVLTYLDAGEKLTTDVEATPGLFYAGDVLHSTMLALGVAPKDVLPETPLMAMKFCLPEMQVTSPETHPYDLLLTTEHGEAKYSFTHFAQVSAGHSQWVFENQLSERACLWVFDAPEDLASTWMELPPFLSGKRLLTTQTFRNLYRSEVIDTSEGLGIREITFLFTDLKGSTALYDQLGDLKAYHLVRQHFDALNSVVVKHSGAVVKTIGDAVMASFCTALEGMQAALEMFQAIDEFNRGRTEQIILKIGLHTGHTIAVTLNDRLDYFGQTVNIAARIQQLADANEIYISQDVYAHNGVPDLLKSCNISSLQANVKGVSGMLQLYKITSR
ncbi:MAG: adenylate/guanylate cyclase domain-containing protein, partial [Bacteroidota bacterium]|nr:adenylate/guanylate cyclase domain-containing protein [Bacteroidota bacterium]